MRRAQSADDPTLCHTNSERDIEINPAALRPSSATGSETNAHRKEWQTEDDNPDFDKDDPPVFFPPITISRASAAYRSSQTPVPHHPSDFAFKSEGDLFSDGDEENNTVTASAKPEPLTPEKIIKQHTIDGGHISTFVNKEKRTQALHRQRRKHYITQFKLMHKARLHVIVNTRAILDRESEKEQRLAHEYNRIAAELNRLREEREKAVVPEYTLRQLEGTLETCRRHLAAQQTIVRRERKLLLYAEQQAAQSETELAKLRDEERDILEQEQRERTVRELLRTAQRQKDEQRERLLEQQRQLDEERQRKAAEDNASRQQALQEAARERLRLARKRLREKQAAQHAREFAEAEAARAEEERRVKAAVELRVAMETQLSELRAKTERAKKREEVLRKEREHEFQRILEAGGNPYEHFRRIEIERANERIRQQRERERREMEKLLAERFAEEKREWERAEKAKREHRELINAKFSRSVLAQQEVNKLERYLRKRHGTTVLAVDEATNGANAAAMDHDGDRQTEQKQPESMPASQVGANDSSMALQPSVEAFDENSASQSGDATDASHPRTASSSKKKKRKRKVKFNDAGNVDTAEPTAANDGEASSAEPKPGEADIIAALPKYDLPPTPPLGKRRSSMAAYDAVATATAVRENASISTEAKPTNYAEWWAMNDVNGVTLPHEVPIAPKEELLRMSLRRSVDAVGEQLENSKRTPVVASPPKIEFLDFDVDQVYTAKVELTNTWTSFNSFRIRELPTAELRDVLELSYKLPGRISAGKSFSLVVTFTPRAYASISTFVEVRCEHGGTVKIPLECRPKECKLRIVTLSPETGGAVAGSDAVTAEVQFGSVVRGEQRSRCIQVVSEGGLEASLDLINLTPDEGSSEGGRYFSWNIEKFNDIRITPYGTLSLQLTFAPQSVGNFSQKYALRVVPLAPPKGPRVTHPDLIITVTATGEDVPIYLERTVVDFGVCVVDRVYKDVLVVHNRKSTAMKVIMDTPPMTPAMAKATLEFVPKLGYVQAKSSFQFQIKFSPTRSMLAEAEAASSDAVVQIPIRLEVPDQVLPVEWQFVTRLTSDDMAYEPAAGIDFGEVSVDEYAVAVLRIINRSRWLPQQYGFVRLPKGVDIAPEDDCFGTLLPGEARSLNVRFAPDSAISYSFALTLASVSNREWTIPCRATGVKPPIALRPNIVRFAPTCHGDVRSVSVKLVNNRKTPSVFEFGTSPSGSHVSVYPSSGTVPPSGTLRIRVDFHPDAVPRLGIEPLSAAEQEELHKLQAKSAAEAAAALAVAEDETKPKSASDSTNDKRANRRKSMAAASKRKQSNAEMEAATQREKEKERQQQLEKRQAEYEERRRLAEAHAAEEQSKLNIWRIPCFVSGWSGIRLPQGMVEGQQHALPFIQLEVHTIISPPVLILLAPQSATEGGTKFPTVDFGEVKAGRSVTRTMTVQNVSTDNVSLTAVPLDPLEDVFVMVNALRPLQPMGVHDVIVKFCPKVAGRLFYETLTLHTSTGHGLVVNLRGSSKK